VRNLAVLAVPGDEIGDVVADHPPEPPALVALVVKVAADVGGGGRRRPLRPLGRVRTL
jgi:hypothetical protein